MKKYYCGSSFRKELIKSLKPKKKAVEGEITMEIMVGQNYKITSDALNIILNKKYLKKDKQGNVTTEGGFKQIGYYTTLDGAFNALIEKEIKRSDAISLDELKKHVESIKEGIFEGLKSVKVESAVNV